MHYKSAIPKHSADLTEKTYSFIYHDQYSKEPFGNRLHWLFKFFLFKKNAVHYNSLQKMKKMNGIDR